jgi:glycosyltransferase involved in cell wall biosynthesis
MIVKELAPMKYADAVIVTSEYERKQVAAFRSDHVFVWGHPLDITVPNRSFSEREHLLFVGGFLRSPSPNEDAMLHFVSEVFPRIHETIESRLFIVGTNHLESVKKLASNSVKVTGYVENLKNYYEKSRIFVVPTRFAAGIPLKLLEAMSYGIPAVVTPLIASQLGLSEGDGFLIGKDDADFAGKVIELYQDKNLWQELQGKALQYIEKNCDPKTMRESLDQIIQVHKG